MSRGSLDSISRHRASRTGVRVRVEQGGFGLSASLGERAISILGAHMSIAGGYHRAAERAREEGCDCVQIFTKNNSQWRAKPISDEEADRFRQSLEDNRVVHPLSHASYLINLASPRQELWRQSVDAMVVELQRAAQLGVPHVVVHPGAYTDSDEQTGIENVARALNEIHRSHPKLAASCALENTAGQGTCLGWRLEHLRGIIDLVDEPERVGVCLDTCHLFAAGYKLAERCDYLATFRAVKEQLGFERIRAFHLNDSKRELGSRVDRHENIGEGHLGLEPFRHLLNDRRFRKVPMYLETPKGDHDDGQTWDKVNLAALRSLLKK